MFPILFLGNIFFTRVLGAVFSSLTNSPKFCAFIFFIYFFISLFFLVGLSINLGKKLSFEELINKCFSDGFELFKVWSLYLLGMMILGLIFFIFTL